MILLLTIWYLIAVPMTQAAHTMPSAVALTALRTMSTELLSASILTREAKHHAFHRFLLKNDIEGWNMWFRSLLTTASPQACTFSIPFKVDGIQHAIEINAAKPDAAQIAREIQRLFNVEALFIQMMEEITNTLRNRGRLCTLFHTLTLRNEFSVDSDYLDYYDFCSCMYSHASHRNSLTQPMIIGLCPELATIADFKVTPEILSRQESKKLIEWAKQKKKSNSNDGGPLDSVDGLPSFTYDLGGVPFQTLSNITESDPDEFARRFRSKVLNVIEELPISYGDSRIGGTDSGWWKRLINSAHRDDIYIFIREYSRGERSSLDPHRDACSYTMMFALNDPTEYEGGLLNLYVSQKVIFPQYPTGTSLVFGPNVVHSVDKVVSGTRWSLVIFLGKRKDEEYPECYVDFKLQMRRTLHVRL